MDSLGWTIIVTSDEEIGSPVSKKYFKELSKDHQYGMIFEPALEKGEMVSSRAGSINFVLSSSGTGGHAGRKSVGSINAITELTNVLQTIDKECPNSCLFNVGEIMGGSGANIVAKVRMPIVI